MIVEISRVTGCADSSLVIGAAERILNSSYDTSSSTEGVAGIARGASSLGVELVAKRIDRNASTIRTEVISCRAL